MTKKYTKQAFEIESLRNQLAIRNKLTQLKKTYAKDVPAIPDINTPKLWDKLNFNCLDYKTNINPMAVDRTKKILRIINSEKGSILNIGFGSGNLEDEIYKLKYNKKNWVGIDISKQSVLTLKKRHPKLDLRLGNINKLKFKKDTFDCVIALEVLEHILPHMLLKSLKQVNRVLKPKGKLVVSVPLNENLEELVMKGQNPNGHVRVYTPELIKAELILTGYKIIKLDYLYAFNRFYLIKSVLARYIFFNKYKPNNIIIVAMKK